MPGLGASGVLDDARIAAVLSYIRNAWGNSGSFVDAAFVAAIRRETADRTLPWIADELGGPSAATAQEAPLAPAITPSSSGAIYLSASKATVFGLRLGYRAALDVLAPWTWREDIAEWRVELAGPATFEVAVELAADDESAGDFFVVETEGSQARGEVPSTGGYDRFRFQPAGRLTLRAGINRIILRPDGPLKRELADVRGIRLLPVPDR